MSETVMLALLLAVSTLGIIILLVDILRPRPPYLAHFKVISDDQIHVNRGDDGSLTITVNTPVRHDD